MLSTLKSPLTKKLPGDESPYLTPIFASTF